MQYDNEEQPNTTNETLLSKSIGDSLSRIKANKVEAASARKQAKMGAHYSEFNSLSEYSASLGNDPSKLSMEALKHFDTTQQDQNQHKQVLDQVARDAAIRQAYAWAKDHEVNTFTGGVKNKAAAVVKGASESLGNVAAFPDAREASHSITVAGDDGISATTRFNQNNKTIEQLKNTLTTEFNLDQRSNLRAQIKALSEDNIELDKIRNEEVVDQGNNFLGIKAGSKIDNAISEIRKTTKGAAADKATVAVKDAQKIKEIFTNPHKDAVNQTFTKDDFVSDVQHTIDTAKASFEEGEKSIEKGDYISGIGSFIKSAWNTATVAEDIVTNPDAAVELFAENLLPILTGPLGMGADAVAYSQSVMIEGIQEHIDKNNGELPNQNDMAIIGLSSLAAAGLDYVGMSAQAKALKPVLASKKDKALELTKPTGSLIGTAVKEGSTEAVQGVLEENISKLNTDYSFDSAVHNFAAGAAAGSVPGTVSTVANTANAAKDVSQANKQAKVTKEVELEGKYLEAFESGSIENLPKAGDDDYDVDATLRVLLNENAKEGVTLEDKEKNLKRAKNHLINGTKLFDHYQESLDNVKEQLDVIENKKSDEYKELQKEAKKLNTVVQSNYNSLVKASHRIKGMEQAVQLNTEAIQQELSNIASNDATQESATASVKRVLNSARRNPGSVTENQLEDLKLNHSNFLTENQVKEIEGQIRIQKLAKSMEDVSKEVLYGDPEKGNKVGIYQHLARINNAIEAEDVPMAKKALNALALWGDRHKEKSEQYIAINEAYQADQELTPEQKAYLEDRNGYLGSKGAFADLTKEIARESQLIQETVNQGQLYVDQVAQEDVQEVQQAEPTNETNTSETTTEEAPIEFGEVDDHVIQEEVAEPIEFGETDDSQEEFTEEEPISFEELPDDTNSENDVLSAEDISNLSKEELKEKLESGEIDPYSLEDPISEEESDAVYEGEILNEPFKEKYSEEHNTWGEKLTKHGKGEQQLKHLEGNTREYLAHARTMNAVKEYFTSKKKFNSLLNVLPNFFTNTSTSEKVKAVLGRDMTENENSALTHMTTLHTAFTKSLAEYIKPTKFKYKSPLHYLMEEDGQLDSNVVGAISIASYDWLANSAEQELIKTDEEIREFFGLDSDKEIDPNLGILLLNAGKSRTDMIEQLGTKAYSLLGIQATKQAPYGFEEKLISNLGTAALAALEDAGFLNHTSITAKEIEEAGGRKADNKHTIFNFVAVKTQIEDDPDSGFGVLTVIDSVKTLKKASTSGFTEKLFSFVDSKKLPYLEPPKTSSVITKRDQVVPSQIMDVLDKQSEVKHFMKKTELNLLGSLSKKANAKIFDYELRKDSEIHAHHKDSVIGKNTQAKMTQNNLVEWVNFLSEQPEGLDTPFYNKYTVYVHHRMGIESNMVNIQQNKIMRHLITPEDTIAEINLDNAEHVELFLLAVGEAFGLKIDAGTPEANRKEIKSLLSEPVIKDAAKALAKELMAGSDFSDLPSNVTNKVEAVLDAYSDEDRIFVLDALSNYSKYLAAKNTEGVTSFESNIFREVDGKNNGPIIGLIQYGGGIDGADLIDKLAKGGIFPEGGFTEFSEWRSSGGKLDAYEEIMSAWYKEIVEYTNDSKHGQWKTKQVKAIWNVLGNLVEDVEGNEVSSAGRKLAKNPLMISIYGAGKGKVSDDVSNYFLDSWYKQIEKAVADNDLAKISDLVININALTGKDNKITFDVYNQNPADILKLKLPSAVVSDVKKNINFSMGKTLQKAIEAHYEEFMTNRQHINTMMSATTAVYNATKDVLIKQAIARNKDKGKAISGLLELTVEDVQKIDKTLEPMLPGFATPFTTEFNEMVVMGKKVRRDSSSNNSDINRLYESTLNFSDKVGDLPKTITTISADKVFDDPGVASAIGGIHNVDSQVIVRVLKKYNVTNVHDALLINPLLAQEVAREMSKSLHDISQEHSILREGNTSFKRAMDFATKTLPNGRSDLTAILSEWVASNKSISLEDKPYYLNMVKHTGTDSNKLIFEDSFNHIVDKVDAIKQDALDRSMHWGQYVANGGTFVTESKVKTKSTNESDIIIAKSGRWFQATKGNEKLYKTYVEGTKEKLAHFIYEWLDPKDTNNVHHKLVQGKEKTVEKLALSVKTTLGSSATEVNIDDFNPTDVIEVTRDSLNQVFNDLSKVSQVAEDPSHLVHLKGIINKLSHGIMDSFKLHTKFSDAVETIGATDLTDIYIINQALKPTGSYSGMLNNGIRMSSQETFAHELVHLVLEAGVKTDPTSRNRIVSVFQKIVKNKLIPVKAFMNNPDLSKNDPSYKDEYTAAKRRWEHIFHPESFNPVTGKMEPRKLDDQLAEFIALGLTNQNLKKALSELSFKPKIGKFRWDNPLEFIVDSFNYLVSILNNKIQNPNNMAIDKQLELLAMRMSGLEVEGKGRIEAGYDNFMGGVSKAADAFSEKSTKTIRKLLNADAFAKNRFKTVRAVSTAADLYVSKEDTGLKKNLTRVAKELGLNKSELVNSTVNEIMGLGDENQDVVNLNRHSNMAIDQERKHVASNFGEMLRSAFKDTVAREDSESLTKVVLKTDLVSLVDDYSYGELMDLLGSKGKLNDEINKRVKALKANKPYHHFYQRSAENLGYFMATGQAIEEHTLLNAGNIAHLGGTDVAIGKQPDSLIKEIDVLASLYAIKSTDSTHLKRAHRVFKEELGLDAQGMVTRPDNGITFLMAAHKDAQLEAQNKIFDGSAFHMIKGYTKEMYNPNIGIVIADASKTAELRKQGYKRTDQVLGSDPKDPTADRGERYVFISNAGSLSTYQKQLFSMTSNAPKGHDLIDLNQVHDDSLPNISGALDTQKMIKDKKAAIQAMFQKRTKPAAPGNFMIPVINPQGKITGYRYMMSEMTKDTLLEKNNAFDAVLGGMRGSIVDKTASKDINRQGVELLFEKYQKDFSTNSSDFVEIGPLATKPEMRELYYLLPEDAREHIKKVWGGDSMYVNTAILDTVFGYRKLSISKQFTKDRAAMRKMHKYVLDTIDQLLGHEAAYKLRALELGVTEVVKELKDFMVVKSGFVTAGNMFSNMVSLWWLGVPIKNIIRDQMQAASSAIEYQRINKELFTLQNQLKLVKGLKNKNDIKNRIKTLEDKIENSPINVLIKEGVMQSIVEDVDVDEDVYSYKATLAAKVDKYTERLPESFKNLGKFVYMSHDTKAYKVLNNAVRLSDFTSRYALYKHYTEGKDQMSKDDAIAKIMHIFIDYDLPTHRLTQYGNDMGLVWFSKYNLRVQRIILESMREKPLRSMALLVLQQMIGNFTDIGDSLFVLARSPLEMLGTPIGGLGALDDGLVYQAVTGF